MFRYFRLAYIACVLLKNRKNIAIALEKLGPAFIKLGQFLSTRPDLVGEELADSFGYLRDDLPAFSFKRVSKIIETSLGKPLESIYSEFDKNPIAAASIAQVHKAVTIDGQTVAVKVRRPKIVQQLSGEIKFFYFVAQKIEKIFPRYKRLKLTQVVHTLENSFKFELDFRLEAAAADELGEKNKLTNIHIPKIDWLRTSSEVLTMEWIEAISIYEKQQLIDANIDLNKLATDFAVMFCNQAFVLGFFHADLHQGNIMVDLQGRIVLLDFGIMGRLDYKNRLYIAQILHGFLNHDYDLIAKVHQQAGYVSKEYMPELFAQSCRAVGEPIMNLSPEDISIAKLLGQLFKITEDFQMETQPQLLLLQKTMIMVEGIGKTLCPTANLWKLAEPWIKDWAKENLSVEAKIERLVRILIKKIQDEIR